MSIWFRPALASLICLGSELAEAQSSGRQVTFPRGATATEIRGTLRGSADATLLLRTAPGQVMQVLFTSANRSCYFNAFEPGREEAVHIGSSAGNEFGRSPTVAGEYRFQIYLMRNAARRNETCRYRISFEVTGAPGGVSAGVSDRQMRDQCQARVASMYAVRSARIRMAAIRPGADGPSIDGRVNKGAEGIKAFRCLFTPARQLRDVMAMTPDGE
ncbi:MAG: hypothetical protein O9342_10595 [Beijerinckiaceae bacterium]|nr:hypothetical protein [Beijerinckiaceae bacterium]